MTAIALARFKVPISKFNVPVSSPIVRGRIVLGLKSLESNIEPGTLNLEH